MTICNECKVELEDDMDVCPLCDTPVTGKGIGKKVVLRPTYEQITSNSRSKNLLQQILWQITAVLLLSGIVATLVINITIQGGITWSVYPISICLIALSYASLVALWRTRLFWRILGGWIISALILVIIDRNMDASWPLKLALPLLSALNVTGLILIFILKRFKAKGLNGLAIIFVFIALLCLLIEATISIYFARSPALKWSIIVAACLLPVTAALLFMYFRTKNNRTQGQ